MRGQAGRQARLPVYCVQPSKPLRKKVSGLAPALAAHQTGVGTAPAASMRRNVRTPGGEEQQRPAEAVCLSRWQAGTHQAALRPRQPVRKSRRRLACATTFQTALCASLCSLTNAFAPQLYRFVNKQLPAVLADQRGAALCIRLGSGCGAAGMWVVPTPSVDVETVPGRCHKPGQV